MNNDKIKTAIIGAAGYTGEELLRIALPHSHIELVCVTSREHCGKSISSVFPRFSNTNLSFSAPDVDLIVRTAETVFLCLPHGLAADYAVPLIEAGLKVIDISADFRLRNPSLYQEYYGYEHPAPKYLETAVYGLPEKNRDKIRAANLVACPGCYPTSIILPLLPLLKDQMIDAQAISISSCSGVTGAGKKAVPQLLFSECNESIRAYGGVRHRHIPEVEQEIADSASVKSVKVNFVPHLIPISRGLYSSIFLSPSHEDVSNDALIDSFTGYYKNEPFVRILPLGQHADTKNVTYTNCCEISSIYDECTGTIILNSAIDNLTKGASGQAIQCFNIMHGIEETTGLS